MSLPCVRVDTLSTHSKLGGLVKGQKLVNLLNGIIHLGQFCDYILTTYMRFTKFIHVNFLYIFVNKSALTTIKIMYKIEVKLYIIFTYNIKTPFHSYKANQPLSWNVTTHPIPFLIPFLINKQTPYFLFYL